MSGLLMTPNRRGHRSDCHVGADHPFGEAGTVVDRLLVRSCRRPFSV